MSRIRCSGCGQEGHNRRNIRCPVNNQNMMLLRFTTPFASQPNIPSELQPRAAQCLIRLLDAMKGLLQLNDIISQPNTYPPTDYVFAIICKSHEVRPVRLKLPALPALLGYLSADPVKDATVIP